jgi:hypothetical protein
LLLCGATLLAVACSGKASETRPMVTPPAAAGEVAAAGAAPRDVQGEATLLLMADIRGVLRPCGCTLDLQKGGFDRLAPELAEQRQRHPDALLVHAGPLLFEAAVLDAGKVAQRQRQSEVAAELVGKAGIAVAGATAVDLAAAAGRYDALVAKSGAAVTVANLARPAGAPGLPRFVLKTVGGLRVGLFALTAPLQAASEAVAAVTDPNAAAAAVVAELSTQADVIVLLSGLGLRNTKRLVRAVAGVHFAVVGGLGEHPVVSDEAELVGGTRVMQFHREGRFLGRLTVHLHGAMGSSGPGGSSAAAELVDASAPSQVELETLDARIAHLHKLIAGLDAADARGARSAKHHLETLRAEREALGEPRPAPPEGRSWFSFMVKPLPWDLPQAPDVLAVMDAFDQELKRINLANAPPLPAAKPGEAVYIGADQCLNCHDNADAYWEAADNRHAHAWKTLVDDNKTFDADCVSCHVTGYGKAGGSVVGQTEGRENVQCEACHGPGSLHAKVAKGDKAGYARTIVGKPLEATCRTCHNAHHSPAFEFAKYKAKVIVPGHGLPLPD